MALIAKNKIVDNKGAEYANAYCVPANILINKREKRIRFLYKFYKDAETKNDETKEHFQTLEVLYSANPEDKKIYESGEYNSFVFMTDEEFNEVLQTLNPFYEKLYSESKKERTKEINEKFYEETETQDPDNPKKTEKVQVQKLRKKQVTFNIINPENFING